MHKEKKTENNTSPHPKSLSGLNSLNNYRLTTRGIGQSTLAATAATAAWGWVAAPNTHATVNTFTFSSPPAANSWTRSAGPTTLSGPLGSLWRGANKFVKVRVTAQGAGLDYVGATVSQSVRIGTGAAFPSMTQVDSVGAAAIFPLRVTDGVDNFFGWLRTTGGATRTVGFSDQPNQSVLAGTTIEVAAVPEPTTALPLLLLGASGLALHRKRKAKTTS